MKKRGFDTIPFVASISVWITFALEFKVTFEPSTVTETLLPSNVGTESKVTTWAASTDPLATWYCKMLTKVDLFSGRSKASKTPSGKAAKASSVGAKTVNGPSSCKVVTRSPAVKAATSVSNLSSPEAISTIFWVACALP